MALPLEQEDKHYTYADVLEWDEDFRVEIINGVLYAMSPPLTIHQTVLMKLAVKIANFLEGKTCRVFPAPFGVRLFPKKDRSDDTVLEPDIVVICDPSKIDERGCNGAPDLVIEILSPFTAQKDRYKKFFLYLNAGVREYWIVDPDAKMVQVYILDKDRYVSTVYGIIQRDDEHPGFISDIAPVSVLSGCKIDLKTIFTAP